MKTPYEEAMTALIILVIISTVIVTSSVFGFIWWLFH